MIFRSLKSVFIVRLASRAGRSNGIACSVGYPSGQDRLVFPVGDCPLRSRELKNLPVTAFPNS